MRLIDADGDVEFAYSNWLAKYIDIRFAESGNYFCSAPAQSCLKNFSIGIDELKDIEEPKIIFDQKNRNN